MSQAYSSPFSGTAPPNPRGGAGSPTLSQDLQSWLVQRRNAGSTPDQLMEELVAAGRDADSAAAIALRSLRSGDHHRLIYWTLTFSAGFGALAFASALHLILDGNPAPLALASWITLGLVAAPLAAVALHWSRQVEARDPHAIWSPTRRMLFATLAGICAFVGLSRLFVYLFNFVAAVVGVRGYETTAESLAQVIVSLSVAVPLFTWSLSEWRRSNVVYRGLASPQRSAGSAPADEHG
jgi:hypothetical protein